VDRAVVKFRLQFEYASFPALATMVAIAAAIAGLVAQNVVRSGDGRARPEESLSAGTVTLSHPASWHRVTAPAIPWLKLKNVVALAPGAGGSGLALGSVPASNGPLPSGLLARLNAPSRMEVVTFGGFDAYRYTGLPVGDSGRLTVYAVPGGPSFTVAACYASAGASSYLRACERIVATLDRGSTAGYALAPVPGYARVLIGAVAHLNARRSAERASLGGLDAAGQAAAAGRLATAYADTANTMSAVSAPAPTGPLDARLVAALRTGATAYRGLRSAAGAEDPGGYGRARNAVARADAEVDATLLELRALGYGGRLRGSAP
jgi:hypothetical protein